MSTVIVRPDNNDLPEEYEKHLDEWCRRALLKENGPLLFDHKHENFENLAAAISETPPERLKERLLSYLMSSKKTYISGYEYSLLMIMAGYDYEKEQEIQVVKN
jgi:hypothetical protein